MSLGGADAKTSIIIGLVIVAAVAIFLARILTPEGGELFRKEGCINCHSFKGQGGSIGPDLTAVTHRRSHSWIRQQIRNPKKHNPNSVMPSFSHLSWWEISAIIRYLKTGSE